MSVLIDIDMPENCRSCFFRGTFGWGASYCRTESDLRPLDNTLPTINNPDARPDWCPLREVPEEIDIPIYDKETRHENCTVQILENTKTGKISIGWWENEVNTTD